MYLTVFLLQAFVSVVEVVAWIFYMFGKNWLLGWWVAYPGWYGAVYGLTLPWIFSILQLVLPVEEGGLSGVNTNEFGNNSIAMIILNMIMWINGAAAHALMAPRLGCHIASNPEKAPRIVKKCVIRKTEGMSDEYYQKACFKAFKAEGNIEPTVNGAEGEDELAL